MNNLEKETHAYWKTFQVIESCNVAQINSSVIPRLLQNYENLFGKTDKYCSLYDQYETKLEKFQL
jgi:hypothetical protein